MLVAAVLFAIGGWWSLDDDDSYCGIVPIVVILYLPWFGVRQHSLWRVFLPPSLLALALVLGFVLGFVIESTPRVAVGLIQTLALAAILLALGWWPDSSLSRRDLTVGTTVFGLFNVLTSLWVGLSEMSDIAVFRDNGTDPNAVVGMLFTIVVPMVVCWRVGVAHERCAPTPT
jgi:hypothetical protein